MTSLPCHAAGYVRSINEHDATAFNALFADAAVVDDAGRVFHGRTEIEAWGKREVFAPSVTLEILDVTERDGATVLTTKVDGNFDRTGLPDPVIIDHHIRAEGGRIIALTCRLTGEPPRT